MAPTPYFQPLHPQVVGAADRTQAPMVQEVSTADREAVIAERAAVLAHEHLAIRLLCRHLKVLMVEFIAIQAPTTVLVAVVAVELLEHKV
jgi:hypothetical protein